MTGAMIISEEDIVVRVRGDAALVHIRSVTPLSPRGTLLFIHSFCGNSRDFFSSFRYFSQLGFSVIGIDMPGRGDSAPLSLEYYQLDVLIGVMTQIISNYTTKPAVVIGKSWGGALALLSASAMGSTQPALVLLDVPPVWSLDSDLEITWARDKLRSSDATIAEIRDDLIHFPGYRHLNSEQKQAFLASRLMPTEKGFRYRCDPTILANIPSYSGQNLDLRTVADRARRLFTLSRYHDAWAYRHDSGKIKASLHMISSGPIANDPLINAEERVAILGFATEYFCY